MRPSALRLFGVAATLSWVCALFAPSAMVTWVGDFIVGTSPGFALAAAGWLGPIYFSVAWYANIPLFVGLFRMLAGRPPGFIPTAAGSGLAATAILPIRASSFGFGFFWAVYAGWAVSLWLGAFVVMAACEVLYQGPASPKPSGASPTPPPPELKLDRPTTSVLDGRVAQKRPWFSPYGARLLSFVILAGCVALSVTTGMQARLKPIGLSVDGPHDSIYQRVNILSPDGSYVAVAQRGKDLSVAYIGDVFEVWVGKADAPRASFGLAFSSNYNTDIAWIDDRHLVVTLGDWKGKLLNPAPFMLPRPIVMLRSVADVDISYRLADRLLEPAYRNVLEQMEQTDRDSMPGARLDLAADQEKSDAAHWKWIQGIWREYRKFQRLVSDDTGNALGDTATTDESEYDSKRAFPSQDGSMIAVLKSRHENEPPTAIASYEVGVGRRDDRRAGFVTVFSTLDGLPDIEWTDAKTLTITLNYLSRVRTSLHRAGDVTIVYRIADRMREADFRQRLDHWRHNAEETEQKRKLYPNETHEKNLAEIERRLGARWDEYKRFQEWVRANVNGGGG